MCLLGNLNMESSDAWLWLFLQNLSGSYSFSRLSHLHAVNFVLVCLADVEVVEAEVTGDSENLLVTVA